MVNMKKMRNMYAKNRVHVAQNEHICIVINKWFGLISMHGTAISDGIGIADNGVVVTKCTEPFLYDFFREKEIKHCLELGTYAGVMSLVLARCCKKVTTIDVVPRTEPIRLWEVFGEDVDYFVSRKQSEIDNKVNSLDFDFAYIDADHAYESIKHDFGLVRKCGKVLFHDYFSDHEGIKCFVDELPKEELTFLKPFVYWEST